MYTEKLSNYIKTLDIIQAMREFEFHRDSPSDTVPWILSSIALDHAQGIKFCLINEAIPSAFSLLRVLYETCYRALWFKNCANEMQLNTFINEDKIVSKEHKKIGFKQIIQDLVDSDQLPHGYKNITSSIWTVLNSFTHSGMEQIARNLNGNSIAPRYTEDEINELIAYSARLASTSFALLCYWSENVDGEKRVEKLMGFLESWLFTTRG